MINKLYSLLIGAHYSPDSRYAKRCSSVMHTERTQALQAYITSNVPGNRVPFFACVVCYEVLNSVFGADIRQLDPENTYNPMVRDPLATPTDTTLLLHDLTAPVSSFRASYKYLDADIKERLVTPAWIDCVGACCLQMLREAL